MNSIKKYAKVYFATLVLWEAVVWTLYFALAIGGSDAANARIAGGFAFVGWLIGFVSVFGQFINESDW